MPAIKPKGRIRRLAGASVRAVGRGFKYAGNAVVHATKVEFGRQLTQSQIKKIREGMALGSNTEYFDDKGNLVILLGGSRGTGRILEYTRNGKLIRDTTQYLREKVPGANPTVYKTTSKEYNPPGRFIGKRVRNKA